MRDRHYPTRVGILDVSPPGRRGGPDLKEQPLVGTPWPTFCDVLHECVVELVGEGVVDGDKLRRLRRIDTDAEKVPFNSISMGVVMVGNVLLPGPAGGKTGLAAGDGQFQIPHCGKFLPATRTRGGRTAGGR